MQPEVFCGSLPGFSLTLPVCRIIVNILDKYVIKTRNENEHGGFCMLVRGAEGLRAWSRHATVLRKMGL